MLDISSNDRLDANCQHSILNIKLYYPPKPWHTKRSIATCVVTCTASNRSARYLQHMVCSTTRQNINPAIIAKSLGIPCSAFIWYARHLFCIFIALSGRSSFPPPPPFIWFAELRLISTGTLVVISPYLSHPVVIWAFCCHPDHIHPSRSLSSPKYCPRSSLLLSPLPGLNVQSTLSLTLCPQLSKCFP